VLGKISIHLAITRARETVTNFICCWHPEIFDTVQIDLERSFISVLYVTIQHSYLFSGSKRILFFFPRRHKFFSAPILCILKGAKTLPYSFYFTVQSPRDTIELFVWYKISLKHLFCKIFL
jgi:hypothetical protein